MIQNKITSAFISDPGEVQPDSDPTFKINPDSRLKSKPGCGLIPKHKKMNLNFFYFDIKVNIADIFSGYIKTERWILVELNRIQIRTSRKNSGSGSDRQE